ncbi:P-loop NTPase family protein [Paenibacillus tyrfis]|uniref:Uncharacterized protein n=1 Tax=Paenibacillus tyrfis TaxID=1501230 RepID=A0A081NTP4_9BACL|nr:hypothetical protein [Paenibacillus tyrfis]KEQ21817.1 hypothetical protein ET33_30895 [Paenibacillus tyrfis]
MRDSLSFLVVGDSESGKSSFIRTFCEESAANLLNISGEGQTTRCNGFYNFTYKENDENKVTVSFYNKEEFTEKQCSKIMKKYGLSPRSADLGITNDYIIKQNVKLVSSEKDSMWKSEKYDILRKICNKDLINDEFINLTEFGLPENMGNLIAQDDIENIVDFEQFLLLITKKVEDIYEEITRKTNLFIELFKLSETDTYENNSKEEISQLKFNLNDNTSLLLTYCIKKATMCEFLEGTDIISLSGIVKSIAVELRLNKDYAQICSSVGIKKIKLVDTYGLDHAGDLMGNIIVENIKERLAGILNDEFRDIDSVIFITPMVGKAPSTNERFKALIEAKRSIIPQIVYTKYDLYAKSQVRRKLCLLDNEELKSVKRNFIKNNSNKIKDDFYDILKDYYSADVAGYRKECIFNNISYFMGTYEIEDSENRRVAQGNNIKYFKNILVSILKNDNYGVASDNIDREELSQQLTQCFILNKNRIQDKLNTMILKAQENLNRNFSISHGRTQEAFWRRVGSNMFGFSGSLNLRNLLVTSYTEYLAKDSGDDHKEDNLGNLVVNEYFKARKLNVFLRECINKFGYYYFCTGCLPCDALEPNKCDMSRSCNTTGREMRLRRKHSCWQFNEGSYTGSRHQSKYCTNSGIYGIGLIDMEYGKANKCWGSCYWMKFFKNFNDTRIVEFNCGDIYEDFVNIFIEFCVKQYTKSIQSVHNFNYLMNYNATVFDESKEEELKTKFKEVTESKKDFIVLTEGETDRIHIETAWKKLLKTDLPFDMYPINGANNFKQFLISYPVDMLRDKIIICILDHDEKGIKVAKEFKKSMQEIDGVYLRMYHNDHDKNRQYYILLLPHINKKFEEYENGEIEFLYSRELLEEYKILRKMSIGRINTLEYVVNNKKYINEEDYDTLNDLFYFEVISESSCKTMFARSIEEREDLDEETFIGFKPLFDLINSIIKCHAT